MSARLRILVVEGRHSAGQAIAGLLRRRGHEVRLVSSAEAALACEPADVLVSDLELPGASGLELLEELRRSGSAARTVFIAARPSLEQSRRALELGAVELLSKPFRLGELVRAVESQATAGGAPSGAQAAGCFDQSYPSAPASVELAARELAAHALRCGISPAARARIAGAAGEAIDNARRHGYAAARGRIRVEAQLEAGELHDTLRHGLARARALAEELEIESRPGGGTRVLLLFRASRVAFEDEGGIDLSELDFLGPELSRRILSSLREGKGEHSFHLSPALAVVVGRLLAGPDPRAGIEQALWS
jgi:CheY-like chemotaxis protein